ncbi:phospholipase D-like domain-containing protein [Hoeflea sp. BAL378]|uniref:phospholipase D-like domain-containing protein n=1 Tax=Hoeflea sp. BAL378 TaxID=1547437 RepID=UPI000691C863|nr:phospholipase D-like domain-containing protein [Hoeflea sp. BAL378]
MRARNAEKAIIQPGRNVWETHPADKVLFLIDADAYFRQIQPVLKKARRSIWIVGWDFNPYIDLNQGGDGPACPLGSFLRSLVDDNDALEIRILIWGEGPIYSGRTLRFFQSMDWEDHPRIHLEFDLAHPVRASHHQKIVVADESLGFAGGMDLTAKRWDDRSHLPDNPLRVTPEGEPYPPVHDVQALVSGQAAAALANVARWRWKQATGDAVPAHGAVSHSWPSGPEPHIENCEVSIALTQPGVNGSTRRTEAVRLTCDAIARARDCIYIEAQYLASPRVARRLAAKLKQRSGPEVIIVAPQEARGALEQLAMGEGMARCVRRLRRADRHNRLRATYAVVPAEDGSEGEILIHAKVVIVDDRFVRVGSSNLNNRSEGLDTECDLAIEAQDDACRAAILDLRNDLLSEHLGAEKEELARQIELHGSVVAALDALNVGGRGLRPLEGKPVRYDLLASIGTAIIDPRMPYWPLQRLGAWPGSLVRRLRRLTSSFFL